MTCGNDLINSQLVTPLAREAEQCAHTGNLNQTPSQTKSSQRKVKLKKHITLMIRYKLKVLTLHSLSFLSFLWPILSIKWIVLIESCCEFCSYQPNIQFDRTVWPNFYYVLGLAQMTEPFLQNTEPFFFIIFQNGYLRSFKMACRSIFGFFRNTFFS